MGATGSKIVGVVIAASLSIAGPVAAQDTSVSGKVVLAAYAALFQDNYTKAVVDPFRKAYPKIEVTYFPMANSAQMLGILRAQKGSPQVDVVIMDLSVAKVGTDEGLYAPLTPSVVTNLADLYPEARTAGVHGPAVTFDHLALIYSAAAFPKPPRSWNELWNPEHKGQVVISAVPDIQGIALTFIATKLAGGDYTKSIDPGVKKLIALAPLVQTWEPKPDPYQLIINGQAKIGIGWNARSWTYAEQSNGKLGVALPEEGRVFQVNTINLVAGSKNAQAAQVFINYALGAEAQKRFTETMFYAPVNRKANVSAQALARTAARPEIMARMIPVDWIQAAKTRDALAERWRREIIPASR
jgi:putative spermidine/putrescine transport system substrate-binding protein